MSGPLALGSAAPASGLRRALAWTLLAERGARLAEALAAGGAAGLLLLCAVVLDAGASVAPASWLLALLAASGTAAAWLLAHRAQPADAARALDCELGEDGLVLSALSASSGSRALQRALVARAEQRLERRPAWRAARPPRAVLALPLLCAAAVLASLLESAPPAAPASAGEAALAARAARLEERVLALVRGEPRVERGREELAELERELERLERELVRLERERRTAPATPTPRARPPRLTGDARPEPASPARLLERVRALAASVGEPETTEDPLRTAEGGARGASVLPETPVEVPEGAPGGTGGQTPPARLGTMEGSSAPGDGLAAAGATERAVVVRRWPTTEDALVRSWLRARERFLGR